MKALPRWCGRAAVLLVVVSSLPEASAGEAEQANAEVEPSIAHASGTAVSGTLQGKDGVRIQTLCTHCNASNIQVGGLSRELVPLSRDGFPLVGGLVTSLVLSILPADTIAGARVVKGPGTADLPGAAAGGEIALEAASADEVPWLDYFAEAGSYSLDRASLRIAGSPGRGLSGAFVAGLAGIDAVDDDGDGWTDVPAVDREFAEGTVEIEPARRHTISIGGSYIDEENLRGRGRFDALRFIVEGRDAWTREDTFFHREEFRAGWEWRVRDGGTLALRWLDATRDQRLSSQLTALPSGFGIPNPDRLVDRFVIEQRDSWGTLSYEQAFGTRWRVKGGVESSVQDVDAINRDLLAPDDTPTALERVELFSTYVDAAWNPATRWNVQLGLRRDDADFLTDLDRGLPTQRATRRSDGRTSPRLTVRYFPRPGWTLRLVAGRTFRPPRPILAEVCCGQEYQTTERVVSERGETFGLEAAYAPAPGLSISAYAARTGFDDHILRVVGWSQVFLQTYALANVPKARAERAEIAVGWAPVEQLSLDASFGWLSFENTGAPSVDVFVVPPSFATFTAVPIVIDRIPYEPERTAAFSAKASLRGGFLLTGQASYTGSMRIQQFERLPFNSTLDTTTLRRTPGFWLVNVSGELPVYDHLRVFVTVDNLTDRLQSDLGDPTTDYNWGPLAGRAWRAGIKISLDDAGPSRVSRKVEQRSGLP